MPAPAPRRVHDAAAPARPPARGSPGRLDDVGGHAASLEVVPDRRIAVAPPGERFGPGLARSRASSTSPAALRTASDSSAALGLTARCSRRSASSRAERSRARSARPATASASARRSSCRSGEAPAGRGPARRRCPPGRRRPRERAPRRAVELHGHPAAPVLAQPGDGRHYFFEAAFSTLRSCVTLPFCSATASASTGRSRADATCSGPIAT